MILIKGHRKYFKDVNMFWNKVERRHSEVRIPNKFLVSLNKLRIIVFFFLQLQAEASSSIVRDTTKVFKNSIENVNDSINNVNETVVWNWNYHFFC